MRGVAYAAGEIIAFLVLAGLIGVGIGLLIGWGRNRTAGAGAAASAAPVAAPDRTSRLEARIRELEAEGEAGTAAAGRVAVLEKELSVAQWQIDALEEELAKPRQNQAGAGTF